MGWELKSSGSGTQKLEILEFRLRCWASLGSGTQKRKILELRLMVAGLAAELLRLLRRRCTRNGKSWSLCIQLLCSGLIYPGSGTQELKIDYLSLCYGLRYSSVDTQKRAILEFRLVASGLGAYVPRLRHPKTSKPGIQV